MTKWLAVIAFAIAILIRLAWRSSVELSFSANKHSHVGYSVGNILFGLFAGIGIVLSVVTLAKRAA
jgi:zinc transporter ZupT